MRTPRLPRRLAALAAGALVLAACQAGTGADSTTAGPGTAPPPAAVETTAPVADAPAAEPMDPASEPADAEPMETSSEDVADEPVEPDAPEVGSDDTAGSEAAPAVRQRCLDTITIMDRRIDEEGFEYPEEEPELSEEELAETLRPGFEVDDSVASPDERPDLAPMTEFDPNTAPILELDLLVETCFETGILTEADVGEDGEDGEDLDEDAEFAAWCEELAALPVEELREFAEEEGPDVVQEEFDACQLPNPIA